jgi:hypothetical protein
VSHQYQATSLCFDNIPIEYQRERERKEEEKKERN